MLVYIAQLQTQQPACSSGSSSGLTSGEVEVVVKVPKRDILFDKEVSYGKIKKGYISLWLASLAAHAAMQARQL